jgi:HCOMODA/2-hydroxy-3-carboxy-muconic semialdehyde decarboxylase
MGKPKGSFCAVLGSGVVLALGLSLATASAQAPPPAGAADPAAVENLVAASRILAAQGVLDGFGHVSIRHPGNRNRMLMSRSLAPALVTEADILEYDLACAAMDDRGQASFIERFIHCEIYKSREDVNAVVHTHSQGVIPFGVSSVALRPLYHVAGFLAAGVPVFEIRDYAGMSNMLIANAALGKALASTLGDKSVVLMRGHGDVVVGPSVQIATYRAVYTDINARLQAQAIALGGPVTYLDKEEGAQADKIQQQVVGRPWELWKAAALGKK